MKLKLIVSFLLLATCFTAFSQEKQNMAVVEKGIIKISIMYPYAEGKTFNMEYYETKHMPMVAGFLGSNLIKYTIEYETDHKLPFSDNEITCSLMHKTAIYRKSMNIQSVTLPAE